MKTLGVWLRQTREARESTLEEAEAATRIRPRFLKALEAGDFVAFPGGEVQIRGFLRIYARYLGLSPDEVLARYDTEIRGVEATAAPGALAETQPALPAHPTTRPAVPQPRSIPFSTSQPRHVNLETLMVLGIVLIVLLAIVTMIGYFMSRNSGEEAAATVTAPAKAELLLTTTVTLASPAVTPTFPANPQGEVTLTLEATEHVWVRVTTDDLTVFDGLMALGQTETWSDQQVIIVETGNGAGLQVTVNDQPQGVMCGQTQVCTRAWGPSGEVAVP